MNFIPTIGGDYIAVETMATLSSIKPIRAGDGKSFVYFTAQTKRGDRHECKLSQFDYNVLIFGGREVKIADSSYNTELGELDATNRKADIAALKAFITKQLDV